MNQLIPENMAESQEKHYNTQSASDLYLPIIKSDDQQIVMGAVYVPGQIDTDGEAMTRPEVEKAAHRFLASGKVNAIDVQHNGVPCGASVIESFLTRDGDPDFPVLGTWVMAVKVQNVDVWQQIKKGELNGFSLAGRVIMQPAVVRFQAPESANGTTEAASDSSGAEHHHDISLQFGGDGQITRTTTGTVNSHAHNVLGPTTTEPADGHAHRLILRGTENAC
jgi:hypothetical protein